MSPYPGQTSPIALQAWGRRLDVPTATDPRVKKFIDGYTNGPQTREQGAVLTGGVDQPGTVPFVQGPTARSCPAGDRARPGRGHRAERRARQRRSRQRAVAGPRPVAGTPGGQASGRPASRRTVSMRSSGSNGLVR